MKLRCPASLAFLLILLPGPLSGQAVASATALPDSFAYAGQFPERFQGSAFQSVWAAMDSLPQWDQEFETLPSFVTRMRARMFPTYAVELPTGGLAYDPEAGALVYSVATDLHDFSDDMEIPDSRFGLIVDERTKDMGSFIAQNPLGVRFAARRESVAVDLLFSPELGPDAALRAGNLSPIRVRMSPASARVIKPEVAVIALFSPSISSLGTFVLEDAEQVPATRVSRAETTTTLRGILVDHFQIVLFNRQTGEVLTRFRL